MMNKKAAMEMSVGTIITVVLGVTLLVGGIIFIGKIVTTTTGVADMTDQQLRNQISKLFSEESKISIYPGTRELVIKQQDENGVGFGIKNLQQGVAGEESFSYIVSASDIGNCGISAAVADSWITVGKSESDIAIPVGEMVVRKVLFYIPVGSPLCTARFKVEVKAGGTNYASDFFDLKIKAK